MPVSRPKRMGDTLLPGPRPTIRFNERGTLFQQFRPEPAHGLEPTFNLDAMYVESTTYPYHLPLPNTLPTPLTCFRNRDLHRQAVYPGDSLALSSLGEKESNECNRPIRNHAGPVKGSRGRGMLSEPLPGPRWHEGPQLPMEVQNLLRPIRDPDELQAPHTLDILEPSDQDPDTNLCPRMDVPWDRIKYEEHSGVPPIRGIFLEKVMGEIRIPELQNSLLNQSFHHLPPVANSDARVRALEFQDPATATASEDDANRNPIPTAGDIIQSHATEYTGDMDSYQYNNGLPDQEPAAVDSELPFSNHGLPNIQQSEAQVDQAQVGTNDYLEQDGVADNSSASVLPRDPTPAPPPPPPPLNCRALVNITNRATTTRGRTVSPIRGESPRMRENRPPPAEKNQPVMAREDSGYISQDPAVGWMETLR